MVAKRITSVGSYRGAGERQGSACRNGLSGSSRTWVGFGFGFAFGFGFRLRFITLTL